MHGRRLLLTLLALIAALTLPAAAMAAGGDPDVSFDGDGLAFADLPDEVSFTGPPIVDQAPDGTLVGAVVGEVQDGSRGAGIEGVRVFRYSTDGEVVDELAFFPRTDPRLLALRVLDDGRIGLVFTDPGAGDTVLARLLADGGADPSVTDHQLDQECAGPADAAAVRSDGGAFLLDDCGVSAYGPSGEMDTDWDGGLTPLEPPGYPDDLESTPGYSELAIAPDGKVLALVIHEFDIKRLAIVSDVSAVVRYEADGGHDATFDGDGVAITPGAPRSFAVAADGRPVLVTTIALLGRGDLPNFLVQRMTTAGLPDETFVNELSPFDGAVGIGAPLCCASATEVGVQSDGKIVLVGDHPAFDRGAAGGQRFSVVRLLEGGGLDTEFGDDGAQIVSGDSGASHGPVGKPAFQADGRILVPFGWRNLTVQRALTVADAPARVSLGVMRLGDPPAVQQQQQQQQQQQATRQQAATQPAAAPPAVAAAPSRRCASRRSFRIRLRTGRSKKERSRIVSTAITVNGKRVQPRRNGAVVNLRNLPKGRFTVVIRLRLADGGRVRDVRRYRTCAPKIERELAPLRTRKPRR